QGRGRARLGRRRRGRSRAPHRHQAGRGRRDPHVPRGRGRRGAPLMATQVQVTFDCVDPQGLGRFWATTLGYIEQPPPEGFDSWDAFLDSIAMPADERDRAYAVVDPDGTGPRLYFQKVPEDKTAKNRVHLDVNAGGPAGTPVEER